VAPRLAPRSKIKSRRR